MGLFGGVLGKTIGKVAGGAIGGAIGGKQGRKIGGELGSVGGGVAGTALQIFKTGGKVKKTGLAIVHKNEYVLPRGVAPTKAQKAKVAVIKRKAK